MWYSFYPPTRLVCPWRWTSRPKSRFQSARGLILSRIDVPANVDAAPRRHNARHGHVMFGVQPADGGAQGAEFQAHEPLRLQSRQREADLRDRHQGDATAAAACPNHAVAGHRGAVRDAAQQRGAYPQRRQRDAYLRDGHQGAVQWKSTSGRKTVRRRASSAEWRWNGVRNILLIKLQSQMSVKSFHIFIRLLLLTVTKFDRRNVWRMPPCLAPLSSDKILGAYLGLRLR